MHQGVRRHREAMATWLASLGVTADADHLFVTHGGQHALSIALGMVARPDATILTESYTYSGMLALSAQCGYRLSGVATDASGLIPEISIVPSPRPRPAFSIACRPCKRRRDR